MVSPHLAPCGDLLGSIAGQGRAVLPSKSLYTQTSPGAAAPLPLSPEDSVRQTALCATLAPGVRGCHSRLSGWDPSSRCQSCFLSGCCCGLGSARAGVWMVAACVWLPLGREEVGSRDLSLR